MHLWPVLLEVFFGVVRISSEGMEGSAGLLDRFAVRVWGYECDFVSVIDKIAGNETHRLDMAIDWMRPNKYKSGLSKCHHDFEQT
jgi:hypothetical protein